MNVLIAPDKFKGTLTATQVCDAIEVGLLRSGKSMSIKKFPLADGGDGTLEIFLAHTRGRLVEVEVHDPLMRKIKSSYGISNDGRTAFIEMARASGLELLRPEERNPMITTSFGTGELISDAVNRKVDQIILGIGGSATNDGALGAAVALGARAVDSVEKEIIPSGQTLSKIEHINLDQLKEGLTKVKVIAICDVSNPFFGANGAAYVYGLQKGAKQDDLQLLDNGLRKMAEVIESQLGIDLQNISGSGAGGGFAGGAHALFGAELKMGTEVVFEFTSFDEALNWADVVITGEGKIDSQTLQGKLVHGVSIKSFMAGKRVLGVCGICELKQEGWEGMHLESVQSLTHYAGKEAALKSSATVLELLAEYEVARKL